MPPAIITPMPFIASVTENKPNSSPKQTTQAEPQEAAPTEPAAQEKNPQEFSKQQSLLFEPTDELIQAYKASDLEKLKKDPELGKLANLIAQNADDIQELVRKQLQAEQEMAETIDALEEDEEAIEEIINPSAANPSGNLKASISNQQEITTLLRTLTSRRALKNQKILWIAKLEKDMAAFEIKKTQKLIDLKNAELELTGNLMKKLTDPLAKVTVTATKFDPSEMLKKLTDTVSQFEKQGNMGELARAKSRLESFKYMLENFNTIQQEIPAAQAHEAAIKQASNKIAALQTDLQKLQAQAEKSTLQQKSASQIIKNVIEQERSSFSNLYKKSLANELNKFAEHLTIEPGEFLEGAFTMEMPKNYTNGVLENMRQAEAAQQTAGTKFKAQPIAKFTVPRAVTQGAKITPVTADALNSLNRALGYVKRVVK